VLIANFELPQCIRQSFRLYCGLVRDLGTVRTSTTSVTSTLRNRSTNSAIDRVEWPMV
jgi:hypothetical protein